MAILSAIFKNQYILWIHFKVYLQKLGVVNHICHPSTAEAEAGGFASPIYIMRACLKIPP